jgi:hypothetical protein
MPELQLTRTREDKNLYALEGVGTLRLRGWLARRASAEAGERSYEIVRRGVFAPVTEATDAAGTLVGSFRGRTIRRGGEVVWRGITYTLRPASAWRERYALAAAADGRELAVFDGKGWGKRPVSVRIDDPHSVDAGLVLFTAFVVRGLAEDAGSASGGAAASTAAVG